MARRTDEQGQMLYQHFKKRRWALLRGEMRKINVFPHSSGSNQPSSPAISSPSSSDMTNGEHPEQEHPEQEQGSNVPETANPRIRPNIRVGTMQSQSIEALFRCRFCDERYESRHNRNQHEREHRNGFNLPGIFRCSFCDGHFETNLHLNKVHMCRDGL